MIDKECRKCDFNDEDYGCTCSYSDKWYACPIENNKPENIQALKEYAEINMKEVKESFNTKYST